MQVRSSMYQLSSWHKLDLVCIKPERSCRKGRRASYAMQNTSAQLLFRIRLDPLKLARDPLQVAAGSPRDLLKILANGSSDTYSV